MNKIILFDGVCTLCNASIDFVLKRDKKDIFKFVSLQSELGQSYLKKFNLSLENFDTIILIEDENFFTASTAVLKIVRDLESFVKYFYLFIYVPIIVRDFIYNIIAKNRYRIFGNRSCCRVATKKEKEKFLN